MVGVPAKGDRRLVEYLFDEIECRFAVLIADHVAQDPPSIPDCLPPGGVRFRARPGGMFSFRFFAVMDKGEG